MIVTYTPDGDQAQAQRWEFDPDEVRASQAEMIEKRFGDPYDKFRAGVQMGNSKARRVLLWHLMARDHHTLRYEDTPDFRVGELRVEHTRPELLALRERVAKMGGVDDETREQVLAALDGDIEAAPEVGDGDGGKATSPSDDSLG